MAQKKWIAGATRNKGALRRQLGVKSDETIPAGVMNRIMEAEEGAMIRVHGERMKITPKLKRRVALAKTLAKMRKS